jgi:hypothetical protein
MDIEARMKESHRIDGDQMVEGGEARLKQNVTIRRMEKPEARIKEELAEVKDVRQHHQS